MGILVAVGVGWLGRQEVKDRVPEAPAERRDVVMAAGFDLPSTASDGERGLIAALQAQQGDKVAPAAIRVDYPQEGAIVPPDFAAPTFLWHDAAGSADAWLVTITLAGDAGARLDVLVPGEAPPAGPIDTRCISEHNEIYKPTPYQASAHSWRPDPSLWAALKTRSVDRAATIAIRGYRKSSAASTLSLGRVTLQTSTDPVGAPIFYRDVPLMPSQTEEGVIKPLAKGAMPLIIWRLKDVGRDDSRAMLTDMPTCANCHSFSADGRTMGMDIDGPQGDRGAYAIVPIAQRVSISYRDVITWNAFAGKPKDFMTIGFLSRVSPDGRFVVSTVNEALYVQNFWN